MAQVMAATDKVEPARRGPDARLLGQTNARVENNASRMSTQLQQWLQRYARWVAAEEQRRIEASVINRRVFDMAKAEDDTERRLRRELFQILTDNGLSTLERSARRTAGMEQAVITDRAMTEFMQQKRIKLQQIMSTTQKAVKESVRQIILTALEEPVRPSTKEIGRRIARVFHGDTGGRVGEVVPAPLINRRVLPTKRVKLDTGGNLYVFSPERAILIARTEMAQAEQEGIIRGYEAAGVEGIKWLAYRDGRSGDREHDEMHGKVTVLGEPFVMPDGALMRWPGDPRGPIKHLANCRCTVKPVIVS